MKRLFWLAMGVTIGALVVRKLSKKAQQFTPGGLADQLAGAVGDARAAFRDFAADVRDAMTERETELRAGTGLDGHLGAKPEDYLH